MTRCALHRRGRMIVSSATDIPADNTPTEDQEYEDLLISVVTQIVTILTESDLDDDDPDP